MTAFGRKRPLKSVVFEQFERPLWAKSRHLVAIKPAEGNLIHEVQFLRPRLFNLPANRQTRNSSVRSLPLMNRFPMNLFDRNLSNSRYKSTADRSLLSILFRKIVPSIFPAFIHTIYSAEFFRSISIPSRNLLISSE